MALTTTITAIEILNRAAAEVGKAPINDPYASQDPIFVQMQFLLNTAGEELMQAYPWEFLVREHQFFTEEGVSEYDLPADFGYMLNQTGWEQSQNIPLGGPLSAQDWTYLKGRKLAQNTLYASFRLREGKIFIYPDPPPVGLDITFEYITINWALGGTPTETPQDKVILGSDIPLYDKTLITRYVKLKYLESAGFDTTKAQDDFAQSFSFLTGFDKGAQIISAGRNHRLYPYLSVLNLPDQGFGL
jgi:hypothetical protein